ncbi:formate/nitrite transporter family protein [Clostridium sp. MSJ-8]|uniref:formate/nitrite transporter family protein n=1 Tax=Clostridium sp. MSJ-8 TaxID=2841510 RepID=UPI001C0F0C40|nr:formate/nitrite transporter family protein [Clostridium sp. MSJ-8]MBU5488876.1 formate/nitrite transporter family protein [Clostridium sp. MSJ-8]
MKNFTNSILGGASISLGCFCYLITLSKTNNAFLAAITFYLGLLLIMLFNTNLFTGKVYSNSSMALKDYASSLAITWVGNLVGGIVTSVCLYQIIKPDVANLVSQKLSLNPLQMIISGIACNILVCASVAAFKKERNYLISGFLILCFVLMSTEHIVANFTYYTIGICSGVHVKIGKLLLSLLFVTIGNIIGGRCIVFADKERK